MILGILVTCHGPDPNWPPVSVSVVHDDLPDGNKFEDMAGVKVTTPGRAAVVPAK